MSGLRTRKTRLHREIYELRDRIISGIEDDDLDERQAADLCHKLADLFLDYHTTCTDLHKEWDVYSEVDKQARLIAEYNRVKHDVDEVSTMVSDYVKNVCDLPASIKIAQSIREPPFLDNTVTTATPLRKMAGQEIDQLIHELETTLSNARQQQKEIHSKLGVNQTKKQDLQFEQGRGFNPLSASTPQTAWSGTPLEHRVFENQHLNRPSAQFYTAEMFDRDPLQGLQKISIPKFRGDKRSFEAWFAAFYQTVGKHNVPPEQKLLRLHSCLEGEALRTIQNLGYSAAAFDVAIARLERKYGGKRRELTMRLEELEKFRRVRDGNASDLEHFAELLDTLIVKLSEAGQDGELGSGSLYVTLLRKLNEQLIVKYQDWLRERGLQGSVRDLYRFVNDEAESWMTAAETIKGLNPERARTTGSTLAVPQVTIVKKWKCKLCSGEHGLWQCNTFKELPVEKRWEKAKELRACFRCLSTSHMSAACKRARSCKIDGCRSNHHQLLHAPRQEKSTSEATAAKVSTTSESTKPLPVATTVERSQGPMEGEPSPSYVTSLPVINKEYLPLRTVPVVLRNGMKSVRINALLDDGSTKSYLNEDVANSLGLKGEPVSLSVRMLNDTIANIESRMVSVNLESCDGRVKKVATAQTTKRVTGNMLAIDWASQKDKWSHLIDVEFPSLGKRPIIDMLIGLDLSDLHCALKEVRGKPGEPIARLTPLGWTSVGPTGSQDSIHTQLSFFVHEEKQLDHLIQQMWEMEDPQSHAFVRTQDKEAEETVMSTMKKVPSGYVVGLPWKSDAPPLKNNYPMALSRLESTERKLSKQPDIAKRYQDVIESYKAKGYINEVREEAEKLSKVWYLPHFPVIRLDKATTKVRPVFDASAKYKGLSLNDVVHQGPKLQNDLVNILTRFRRSPVALVCDITEMYLQVHLKPEDKSVHRFLWRDMKTDTTPKVYEFNRVVFGVNASPYMAQLVAQHNARENASEFPRAAETVIQSTYMDDSMDSVETVEEATALYHELTALWKKAGMTPRKWLSNSKDVLKIIPTSDCVGNLDLEAGVMPVIKTLGISWEAEQDQFKFVVHIPPDDFRYTKRSFLSRTATLFDPLGFVSPYTIRARMLLQEMWMAGLTWDQELPDSLHTAATKWFNELPDLCRVKVPRSLKKPEQVVDSQLHVFVDASQAAYGAVAYLRHEYQSGDVSVRLVMSKAKVTPLQSISVPRLELMAAVVGLHVAETAGEALGIPNDKWTFWSDSLDVLYWLRGHSCQFKPFVSNRVGLIQSTTNPVQWRYTPTKSNPADKLSRGLTADKLVDDRNWWEGPDYLSQSEEQWPAMNLPVFNQDNQEKKCKFVSTVFVSTEAKQQPMKIQWKGTRLDPECFASWFKYIRVLAYVLRFINNSSSPAKKIEGVLTVDEIRDAEMIVISQAQQEAFQEELSSLRRGQPLPVNSKIIPISPVLGTDGLLHGNSRLRLADHIAWETRHPIILPRKHRVTRLIIDQLHKDSNHGGTNYVLSLLSAKYWLPGAREEIRECEKTCMVCRRRKAKPATQIMAPLPAVRAQMSLRAFTNISVDFAGPFLTKQGRGKTRFKRYLCLFACMNTRAVHLEMAYGLDTDSFLNAFYRMASRRGNPVQVISDNGTNFVGANRELKELVNALDKTKIQDSLVNRGVSWKFNPPSAPHFNGLHEILIRAAKRAMFHVLNKADLTDEELMTAIVGAEGLLNSRPITYQSSNADDAEPLTPNHFLFNQVGGQFAPESVDTEPFNPRTRWRRVQEVVHHFWKRWLQEWLPSLSPRKKWGKEKRDLKVGDLVLVLSTDTPRGKWPLGRIMEVFPGPDGHVRTADVKVKGTVLRRPIVKLCPLECEA